MRLHHVVAPTVLALLATSARADDADRYQLQKTPEGYIRLDTRTGEMSKCQDTGDQIFCRRAKEETTTSNDAIDRLNAKVEALESRVEALERAPSARLESNLPSEEEFNKTMGYMERFFRSFMGIVKDFDRNNSDSSGPGGQKT